MNLIFRQIRIGRYGRPFTLYKFRSMVEGADKIDITSTSKDDPRVTKIGKIIRKLKIDELPQLWNVINGDMALVGPRPELQKFIDLMTPAERDIILSVKPGMTDLASLWDINEEDELEGKKNPDEYYLDYIVPEKKRLQIEYVKTKSKWLDIKIITKTLWNCAKRLGKIF